MIGLSCFAVAIMFAFFKDYIKFPVAFLIFILTIDLNFKFINTGRYSYLLHLYHSPIMVISYPVITRIILNPSLRIITQIIWAIILAYGLFLATKRIPKLRILSGGR